MTSTDPRPIRVVIADDHALYRQSLQLVITLDRDIEVVALASDGQEALHRVRESCPDVLVLDLQMPKLSGLEAIRAISQQSPTTRILMLTMSEDPASAVAALLGGADGYVTKDASGEQVAEAIRELHRGRNRLAPTAAATLLEKMARLDTVARADTDDPEVQLDRRILHLLAGGEDQSAVAAAVGVSEDEVRDRITDILTRLRAVPASPA